MLIGKPKQTPLEMDRLLSMLDRVLTRTECPKGDIAECGVDRGGTAYAILSRIRLLGLNTKLHLFDYFSDPDDTAFRTESTFVTSNEEVKIPLEPTTVMKQVQETLRDFPNVAYYRGYFQHTLPQFDKPLSFCHVDADFYYSTMDGLLLANRLMVPHGILVIHDWKHPYWGSQVQAAVRQAITWDRWVSLFCGGDDSGQLILERK